MGNFIFLCRITAYEVFYYTVLSFSVVPLTTKQYKLKYCTNLQKNYNQKLEPFSYVLTNLSLLKAASLGKIASKVWRMCEDLEIRWDRASLQMSSKCSVMSARQTELSNSKCSGLALLLANTLELMLVWDAVLWRVLLDINGDFSRGNRLTESCHTIKFN